jgi:hypothetical protein
MDKLAEYQFNLEDQKFFAKVSGDYNPIHVDLVFSRRTMFGKIVVHGIHGAIWALDNYLSMLEDPTFAIKSLKLSFLATIDLSHCVEVYLVDQSGFAFTLEVWNDDQVVTIIDGVLEEVQFDQDEPLPARHIDSPCNDLVFEQMESRTGVVDLFLNEPLLFSRYPNLQKIQAIQIAQILSTSKIVGMECPGKHSLFCNLDLQFHKLDLGALSKKVFYETMKSNKRYSIITLKVEGDGVAGSIKSIIRPAPFQQPEIGFITSMVAKQEFRDQRALIIGGSRGLGEVAAKIIAAGGGECIITYNKGRDDAFKVASEIQDYGGTCDSVKLDILSDTFQMDALVDFKSLTHVYYFATPLITLSTTKIFSFDRFNEFSRFYIRGFCDLIDFLSPLVASPLKIFYPSTIFLDTYEKNSVEYCASKAAAETICRYLEEHTENRFFIPRLPRVRTDQTNSILPLKLEAPTPVLLNSFREMNNYFGTI